MEAQLNRLSFGTVPKCVVSDPALERLQARRGARQRHYRQRTEGAQDARKREGDKAELQKADGKQYRLFEGTILEGVLTNRLDGSFSGPVNVMLTTSVYSHDRQRLLIPQGTRILGEVQRVNSFGQQRLAVFFHRMIMPDGYSVSLDRFQGLNQIGETGLRDKVNRHYLQTFGVSLAVGAIAGLAQANTRYGFDVSGADAYRQGVSTSLSQSSLRILDRYLNILPTFTIREGHRIKVHLTNDMLLPEYGSTVFQMIYRRIVMKSILQPLIRLVVSSSKTQALWLDYDRHRDADLHEFGGDARAPDCPGSRSGSHHSGRHSRDGFPLLAHIQ